jgi:hypothetical protein
VECNIDQAGRKARLVTGFLVDSLGTVLVVAGFMKERTELIVVGAILSVAGTFMIFEGLKGWCVLRAMGFKTKI